MRTELEKLVDFIKNSEAAKELLPFKAYHCIVQISDFHLEQETQQSSIFGVVGRSEQLESGLTCMMCRKEKENDGHSCCEDCGGIAF